MEKNFIPEPFSDRTRGNILTWKTVPEQGHRDEQRAGAPILWRQAEIDGVI